MYVCCVCVVCLNSYSSNWSCKFSFLPYRWNTPVTCPRPALPGNRRTRQAKRKINGKTNMINM